MARKQSSNTPQATATPAQAVPVTNPLQEAFAALIAKKAKRSGSKAPPAPRSDGQPAAETVPHLDKMIAKAEASKAEVAKSVENEVGPKAKAAKPARATKPLENMLTDPVAPRGKGKAKAPKAKVAPKGEANAKTAPKAKVLAKAKAAKAAGPKVHKDQQIEAALRMLQAGIGGGNVKQAASRWATARSRPRSRAARIRPCGTASRPSLG